MVYTAVAADGSYKLTSLKPGTYALSVGLPIGSDSFKAHDWAAPAQVSVATTLAAPGIAPDIILTSGAIIEGSVLDISTKRPIPDVIIDFQGDGPRTKTDSDGKFSAHVLPGKTRAVVFEWPPVNNPPGQNVVAVAGQTVTVGPIYMESPAKVSGVAVDEASKAISDISIDLGEILDESKAVYFADSATTDQAGRFNFQGAFRKLTPGTYRLFPGYRWTVVSPTTVSLPDPAPIKLILKKSAMLSLQGMVVDTAGKPVSGADLTFDIDEGNPGQATLEGISGVDGKFAFAELPTNVSLIKRARTERDGYVYRSGGEVKKASDQIIVSPIVMSPINAVVDGVVHNGLGKPVAYAWIYCPDSGDDAELIQTNVAGHFKLNNLAPGKFTLLASKGLFSTKCIVQASAVPANTIVQLPKIPTLPLGESNLTRATALLTKHLNDIMLGHEHEDSRYPLDESAHIIAEVSPDAAVKYILSSNSISTDDLDTIVSSRLGVDPAGIAQWALAPDQKMSGNTGRGLVAAEIGLAVAPNDLSEAKEYFDIAARNVNLSYIDARSIDTAMNLTALAYALNRPEADDDYAKVAAALDLIIADDRKQANAEFSVQWRLKSLSMILAKGNVDKAIDLLSKTTAEPLTYNKAPINVINELVQTNPIGAMKVFHYIDSQTNSDDYGTAERALCAVIPILYRSDPAATLAKVTAIRDPAICAHGLTDLADLLPMPAAASLYVKAEDKASYDVRTNDDYSPACVAYHAWLRDKTLGAKLYKEAFKSYVTEEESSMPGNGPSNSQFAFYYAHFDPAYSRLLLEKQFAKDNHDGMLNSNGDQVDADVEAMATIDLDRALTMTASMTNHYRQYDAGFKVAQYVLLTPDQRAQLPFTAWVKTNGWTPGSLSGD